MSSSSPPPYSSTRSSRGLFGTGLPSTISFAVGVALFFLPFAEFQCNQIVLADNTGLGIATGTGWRVGPNTMMGNDPYVNLDRTRKFSKDDEKINYFALAGLAAGIIGLALGLIKKRHAAAVAALTAVLGIASLAALWIDLKRSLDLRMNPPGSNAVQMQVTLAMTPWFFLTIVAYFLAAVFCFNRWKSKT